MTSCCQLWCGTIGRWAAAGLASSSAGYRLQAGPLPPFLALLADSVAGSLAGCADEQPRARQNGCRLDGILHHRRAPATAG